jgi:diadenosine tetraphosphate (Ap4A) HIT family hydrolase
MEMVYAHLECVFCKPGAGRVFQESELIQCLWDGYPISPGHALITPKRHVETWFEATDDEKIAIFTAVDKVKEIIEQEHNPTAYNIGINSGRDAGQTIPHLHLHVIPRYPQDIEDARGGIRNILPAKARWWEQE